jgi:hypothetical protein
MIRVVNERSNCFQWRTENTVTTSLTRCTKQKVNFYMPSLIASEDYSTYLWSKRFIDACFARCVWFLVITLPD